MRALKSFPLLSFCDSARASSSAFWNKSPIWTAESKEEHGRKRISQGSSPGLSRDQPCSLSHSLLKELYLSSDNWARPVLTRHTESSQNKPCLRAVENSYFSGYHADRWQVCLFRTPLQKDYTWKPQDPPWFHSPHPNMTSYVIGYKLTLVFWHNEPGVIKSSPTCFLFPFLPLHSITQGTSRKP